MSVASDLSPSGPRLDLQLSRLQKRIAGRIRQGFYSQFDGLGVRRDLTRPLLDKPQAQIPIAVRRMQEAELDFILPPEGVDSPEETQQIIWRRHFYKKAPKGCCFVAVDLRNGTPCFLQWLFGHEQNNELTKFKCFPRLEKDEALIEQSYTLPSHRGLGILTAAMAMISERALDTGARYVLGFCPANATNSLKACKRAGFEIDLIHRRTQIGYGLIIHNSFKKLAAGDPRRRIIVD